MKKSMLGVVACAAALAVTGAVGLAAASPQHEGHDDGAPTEEAHPLTELPEGAAVGETIDQPATQPIPDSDTVDIKGTGLVVPIPEGAGTTSMNQTSTKGHGGVSMDNVRFNVPGPIDGTFVGSINVVAIGNVPVPTDLRQLAHDVDQFHESSTVVVAGTEVAFWPTVGGLSGADIKQQDRNFSQYAFPSADGKYIIEVIFDDVAPDRAEAYVAELLEVVK
jgi:hypothetical protein